MYYNLYSYIKSRKKFGVSIFKVEKAAQKDGFLSIGREGSMPKIPVASISVNIITNSRY
jgi:hypothetical protein